MRPEKSRICLQACFHNIVHIDAEYKYYLDPNNKVLCFDSENDERQLSEILCQDGQVRHVVQGFWKS